MRGSIGQLIASAGVFAGTFAAGSPNSPSCLAGTFTTRSADDLKSAAYFKPATRPQ